MGLDKMNLEMPESGDNGVMRLCNESQSPWKLLNYDLSNTPKFINVDRVRICVGFRDSWCSV